MNRRAKAACLLAFVAALFCLLLPPQAQASEEILFFHADIQVLPDGTLDVTETVRYAIGAGVETRGIDRDLSMNVRTASGRPARVTFTIVSVTRNGQPEPYRIMRQSGLARIGVGLAEGDLPAPSEQLYEIRYRTGGRVQAFDGQDVLNWSVTGEHWRIPIRTASVTVTLPEGVSLRRHTAERHGSNGRALLLDLNKAADGSLLASTNNVLLPGDGLTISFAWKKLPPVEQQQPNSPPGSRNSGGLELDQLPGYWPLLFTPTLLGGLIFLACRLAAGRQYSPGVISPEFEPPNGIGPAEARYLLERAYDDRCLAAAIANMAVKRALLIEQEPSRSPLRQFDFRLVPLGKAEKGLTVTERAIYDALFPKPIDLTLNGDYENGRRVYRANSAAMSWLSALNQNNTLSNNPKCFWSGVALAVGSAVILPYVSHATQSTDRFFIIWLVSLFTVLALILLILVVWRMIRIGIRTIDEAGCLVVFLFFITSISLFVFSYIYDLIASNAGSAQSAGTELLALGSGTLFGFFLILFIALKTPPTKTGRKLMDRLEGFALYLRTAEEERLKFFDHPENTPERLERIRPYIIALGDPNAWTEDFARMIGWVSGSHLPKKEDSFHTKVDQGLIDAVEAVVEQEAASRPRQQR